MTIHPLVPDDRAETWGRLVADTVVRHGLPSVSVAIYRGRDVVWATGRGFRHLDRRDPATPDVVYRIASITKLFTAVGVLALDGTGLLSIDDPVTKYVPSFPSDAVTLRHLLAHASGVQRETPDDPGWVTGHFLLNEDFREAISKATFPLRPMERWKYSNFGYNVLGEVIRATSGMGFEQFITERILWPLGLDSTAFDVTELRGRPIATGYRVRSAGGALEADPQDQLPVPAPAGQLFSSVLDLSRFAAFLVGDLPGPLDPVTLSAMRHPLLVAADDGLDRAQGLGPLIVRGEKSTLIGHAGGLHSFASWILVSPETGIGAVALTNVGHGEPLLPLVVSLINSATEALGPVVRPAAYGAPPSGVQALLGRYWGDGGIVTIAWSPGGLTAIAEAPDGSEVGRTPMTFLGDGGVRADAGPFVGEIAKIDRSTDGAVTGFEISTYRFDRI